MQGSASLFDEGRFGPVYRSHDPETNQPVLVRTFAQPLTPAEQNHLLEALARLCERPLDHPSIARPVVAGIEEGRPFLVHTLLPGTSLQRYLEEHGPRPFAEAVLRITQLAAAIDFAAAAGIHHGDLGVRDVILDTESTGISGFGVMQALIEAGVGNSVPSHAGDVQALARMTYQLLTGRPLRELSDLHDLAVRGADSPRVRSALTAALSDRPDVRPVTALAFAAALQQAVTESPAAPTETPERTPPPSPAPAPVAAAVDDLLMRPEHDSHRLADVQPGPIFHDHDEPPLHRPDGPVAADRPVLSFGAHADTQPGSESHGWFLIAAALAVGILAGFTAGYMAGQRNDLPIPRFAADLLDRAGSPSRQPESPQTAPSGSTGTALGTRGAAGETREPESGIGPVAGTPDSGAITIEKPDISSRELEAGAAGVGTGRPAGAAEPPASQGSPATAQTAPSDARSPSVPAPATPAPQPPSRPAAPAPSDGGSALRADGPRAQAPAAPRVPPGTPGGLQVLSRPEGAQVFVDGALVGRTPLLIPSVDAGPHDVRLELDNHRIWATRVRVEPGARARVAASLEILSLP